MTSEENSPNNFASRFERLLGFGPTRADAVAGLALFASLLWFFAPVIFQGQVFFFRDLCLEIVPKRAFLAQSGLQALWNPYCFFGLPEAANSQTAAFYPLNLIFQLGAAPQALSAFIVLHFAISLTFTYLLVRARGGRAPAALAAAIAFTYGGFFVSLGNQVVVLNSATWIMALLWAADRGFTSGRRGFTVAAGLFWGLMVLGGEPEIAYLSGLILVIYFLALILAGALSRRAALGRALFILAGALVVALGLSAVQWLLTLELTPLSNRAAGLSFADAVKWSVEPKALSTLLFPNFIMDPATSKSWVLGFQNSQLPYLLSWYPGILVLALSLLGVSPRPRPAAVLAAGAVLFLWLSLGATGGLYHAFYALLPGFDHFRIPERCLFGFAVFLALLVGPGLERLWPAGENPGEEPAAAAGPSRLVWLLPIVLTAVGIAALALSLRTLREPLKPEGYLSFHQLLQSAVKLRAIFAICLGLAVFLVSRLRPGWRASLAWAMCLLIFADLYFAHRDVNPSVPAPFYDLSDNLAKSLPGGGRGERVLIKSSPNKVDNFLGAGRSVVLFYQNQRRWLQPFTGLEVGLTDVGARSSFYPADADLWSQLATAGGPAGAEKFWSLAGIHYVLQPGQKVVSLNQALPRAYLIPSAQWLPDRPAVMAALRHPDFDPKKTVLLEGRPPPDRPPQLGNIFWPMTIAMEDNQKVVIAVEPGHAGYVVLLDSFFPGWEARVNGKPAPIYRANGFFRAAPVGQDGGLVEFRYWPTRFLVGLAVSLLTLLICGFLLWWGRAGWLFWLLLVIVLAVLPLEQGGTTYVPVTMLRILVLLLSLGWALRLGRGRETRFFRTRLDPWVMAFWALAAMAFYRSAYFYISLYWCLNIMTLILLFYFTVQFTAAEPSPGGRRADGILAILIAGYTVQAAWAGLEWLSTAERAAGGYFNPSFLAGSLMALSPYLLARGLASLRTPGPGDRRRAGGFFALFLLFALGVVASQSRAVVIWPLPLALVAAPGLEDLLFARGRTRSSARRLSLAVVIGVVVLAGAALFVFPNPLKERMRSLSRNDIYAFSRVQIWKSGLGMIKDHPLGVGPGMFKYYSYRRNFPVNAALAARYERHPETAHNEYIHLAAELSPLAVACLVVPAALLLAAAGQTRREKGRSAVRLGLAAGIFCIALHALFDSNLHDISIAALAAVLAGLLLFELAETAPGWIRAAELGRGARRVILAVFVVLTLGGVPGYVYLGWSYGLSLKAELENEPGPKLFRLQEAMRHSFGNAIPAKLLAAMLNWQGREGPNVKALENATKVADLALTLNPADPAAYSQRGKFYLDLYLAARSAPLLDHAESSLREALARNPFDVDAWFGLSRIAKFRGRPEEQLQDLQKTLELEPHYLSARSALVLVLLEAGRRDEARAQWREYLTKRAEIVAERKRWSLAFASVYKRKLTWEDPDQVKAIEVLLSGAPPPPP